MVLSIRAEMPIPASSKILELKTIGNLRKKYTNLRFIKYIYRDPKDGKLKGANPSDDLPLVPNAYITMAGDIRDIEKFSEDLVVDSE